MKDWIWDKLFLDFYLDKRFSWRFKLMNWLSKDWLRSELSSIRYDATLCQRTLDYADNVPSAARRRLTKITKTVDDLMEI